MIIPQRIYRFYLTIGSSTVEVFPLNFLESKLVDQLEGDQIFYRRKFSGTLIFTNNNGGDDFDLIYSVEGIDPCEKIYLLIERDGAYYWDGSFSFTDGEIDLDRCTFEVTPAPEDDYVDILNEADIQYNILDVATIVTVSALRGSISKVYTRNRWLARLSEINVLEYLADKIVPGVLVSSHFFTDVLNPVTLAYNHLRYLTIAQKSDIIRPASSDPATTAMMSWNELMDILWGMFQVKWDYDPTIGPAGTINVEHISWFPVGGVLDLRGELLSRATNKYVYLKEKMPKYEKFSFSEADDINFVGVPIIYNSPCVDQNPESNIRETTVNVTTDLEYIIDNPTTISDEGFVILCNYLSGGLYYVEIEQGKLLTTESKLNMHLAWSNLHDKYFRYNRVLMEGFMNGLLTDFWTALKTKKQQCSTIICPEHSYVYQPEDEVQTELGDTYFAGALARIEKSELNPNGEMDFSLIYGDPDNILTPIGDEKTIYIWQDGIDTCHAVLSQPADAELTLGMEETLYDDACVFKCTGASEPWVIHAGETTSTFTFASLCDTMFAGWSIEINIDTAAIGLLGWTVPIFDRDPLYNYHDICP